MMFASGKAHPPLCPKKKSGGTLNILLLSMPDSFEELARNSPRHVVVCDYIAGMTDQFLLRQHHEHIASSARATGSAFRAQQP